MGSPQGGGAAVGGATRTCPQHGTAQHSVAAHVGQVGRQAPLLQAYNEAWQARSRVVPGQAPVGAAAARSSQARRTLCSSCAPYQLHRRTLPAPLPGMMATLGMAVVVPDALITVQDCGARIDRSKRPKGA